MTFTLAKRIAALAFALLGCAQVGRGDTLVVGGRKLESATRFAVVGDEVYTPLVPALRYLGAQAQLTADAIRITTAAGREVIISRARPEATLDGMLRPLPGTPLMQRGTLFLPTRAVGSLLGCAVRWDEGTRTVFVCPWIRKFALDPLPDGYRLTVGAEAPLAYRTGKAENPPRLFIDVLNADLAAIPSEVHLEGWPEGSLGGPAASGKPPKGAYIGAARIRQNTLAPAPEGDVVRAVVELAEWKPYRIHMSGDRCTLQVDFPLADTAKLPLDGPPGVLSAMTFERVSPRVAMLRLAVFGRPACTSGATDQPPSVWLDIANTENRLEQKTLQVQDSVVCGVTCGPSPDNPRTQRVTITLTQPTPHAVVTHSGEVRVLLGRTELDGACVVVDAGHGGHDTGAMGRSGLMEKEVNLDIAQRVRAQLEELGAKVLMTRTDDNPVIPWDPNKPAEHRAELLGRCALANDAHADLFVSIHCNARESNPTLVRGTETYFRKADSLTFAQVMQEEVVRAVGLPDGGVKYHPRSIIVLYQTNMPAVLVEVAYLSNPDDEAELLTEGLRERAALGIVSGVKRYVEEGGLLSRLAERESGTLAAPTAEQPPPVATPGPLTSPSSP
jgi:N-acetylmuramoyl-L-alanine amidase